MSLRAGPATTLLHSLEADLPGVIQSTPPLRVEAIRSNSSCQSSHGDAGSCQAYSESVGRKTEQKKAMNNFWTRRKFLSGAAEAVTSLALARAKWSPLRAEEG